MRFILIILFTAYSLLSGSDSTSAGREPDIHPTPLWGAMQLIPSPQWAVPSNGHSSFGLRWQVTPLLYSFGINRKLKPWRYLISEPLTRYNGSVEWFVSPEYFGGGAGEDSNWMFRTGIRAYVPLLQHGEYLAASAGGSYFRHGNDKGASYEGGIYIFFGILGLQATYTPSYPKAPWILTVRIRYF